MVLNSVTGCFGAQSELLSVQIRTKSTVNGQQFEMPLVGEILGQCDSITLADKERVKYFTIFYTTKTVTGLMVETDLGSKQTLGKTTNAKNYKYTVEDGTVLVGFYGTKVVQQINSLGLIYLNPSCLPPVEPTNKPDDQIDNTPSSSAGKIVEHVIVAVLAAALVIACGLIVYLCKTKRKF